MSAIPNFLNLKNFTTFCLKICYLDLWYLLLASSSVTFKNIFSGSISRMDRIEEAVFYGTPYMQ